MGLLGGVMGKGCEFDDIIDLIIILIVLQFLCVCVLGETDRKKCC